jgi:uncharacterized membrane protein YhhN
VTPDLPVIGLSFAALASGVGAIIASYDSKGRLAFNILKPLTTLLIFIMVLFSFPGSKTDYPGLIAVGLLFSLAGDIFLMFSPQYFVRGILSFSVTHALYLLAFATVSGIALIHPFTPLLVIIAVALAALIWRGVKPSLRMPVLAYTVLITAMATQATGAVMALRTTSITIAAAGALLFFVSDAVLAIDRFRSPFVSARAIVLSSYWLGQLLIAISTGP